MRGCEHTRAISYGVYWPGELSAAAVQRHGVHRVDTLALTAERVPW